MNTRVTIESTITLTDEDKKRNVKYMMVQMHFNCLISFYNHQELKYCKFKIQNSNKWEIQYDLPLAYCLSYRSVFENGGEEWEYYHAIFKDLKFILLSKNEDEWYINLFDSREDKNEILKMKNEFFKPILDNVEDVIGDTNIKNLMLLLAEV